VSHLFEKHGVEALQLVISIYPVIEYESIAVIAAVNPGAVILDNVAAVERPVCGEVGSRCDRAEKFFEHICTCLCDSASGLRIFA